MHSSSFCFRVHAHANFHIFYYFYDGLDAEGRLGEYSLDGGRSYRYLGTAGSDNDHKAPPGPREQPNKSSKKFKEFDKSLAYLEFDEYQRERIYKTLAAILLLGEIEFVKQDDGKAGLANNDHASKGKVYKF